MEMKFTSIVIQSLFVTPALAFSPLPCRHANNRPCTRRMNKSCLYSGPQARVVSEDGNEQEAPNIRFVQCPCDEDDMPFYALGVNLASQVSGAANLKELLSEKEMDVVIKGFTEQLRGTSPAEIIPNILQTFGPTMNQILQERSAQNALNAKKEGEEFIAAFLQENEKAVQTESGLVYLQTEEGTGKSPTLESQVEVHYHGTLIDGTVFDSSVDRGQQLQFPLANVIQGWQEGLQLMKEGGSATLVCPPSLGYGDMGSPPVIPPGATLKFNVQLLQVLS